tara:strand:- start:30654 stop:30893 length:240 start_codon:yes stop_codon:yes gene_type:complete
VDISALTNPFNIRVTPNASRNAIKMDGDIMRVYVTTVPESGKANKAVIVLLSKELNIAKSKISIVKGETGKDKTIFIAK